MSNFVAWLVSTILAVGTTVAPRFLTEIEVLNWIFIPMWIVNLILFFAMLYNLVAKLEDSHDFRATFATSLIATIVTLALVFFASIFKLPVWIPIVSGVITFVIFCFFLYVLSDYIDDLHKAKEEEEERRRRKNTY